MRSTAKIPAKRIAAFIFAFCVALSSFTGGSEMFGSEETNVYATSSEAKENQNAIDETESEIAALEQKQAELDEKIASAKEDIESETANNEALSEQIDTVERTLQALAESISELEDEIAEIEAGIADKEESVEQKKEEIYQGVEDFKLRLRALYIAGNDTYTDLLVGATDFYDMLMKIELVKRVANHDNEVIENLIALRDQYLSEQESLNSEKDTLDEKLEDLEAKREKQQSQLEKLEELYAESEEALGQLEADKELYEGNLEELEKEQEEFEEELQELYEEQEAIKKAEEEAAKKKAAEEAAAKKAAEEAAKSSDSDSSDDSSDAGSSGSSGSSGSGSGSSSTSSSSTSSSSTSSSSSGYSQSSGLSNADYGYTDKSMFTWPVPGFYHISYGVGYRWGSYHKGIDIYSSNIRGAKIIAAASGTVIKVSNTCTHDYGKSYSCGCGGGYGNYCIIDHGGGYWTLYGHSEKITVSVGDYVEQGDVLGTVGSTGHSTGPHLHFEIRINGTAVDPQNYV